MRRRLAGLAMALTALTGCQIAGGQPASVSGKDTLVIGVSTDRPGLGLRRGGTYEGFDIDVAREIARRLGARHVTFEPVTSATRETVLLKHDVDLVVSTYSITPERKTKITFGGPYYVAHQDILVRKDDVAVHNVRDLRGRGLCQVAGSNSWRRVTEERKVPARLVPAKSYAQCVDDLIGGSVDAVSTDDLILAGFAARHESQVRFVNAPFTDEKYGVGLPPGDLTGCEDVNKAITEMYQDGTAAKLLRHWFGRTGLNITTTVPQFEGCG